MRILVAVASCLAMSLAAAQQPLTSPIYYLSTAPRLELQQPVTGVLDERSGRNFKDGSYLDVLTLRGAAGDYVELLASSNAFDTYLSLFAPDGSLVDYNDDDPQGTGTDAAIRTTLPVTGTYLVVVSGFGPWDLGPYTVTRRGAPGNMLGATLELPSLTSAALAPDGRPALFSFDLTETSAVGLVARSQEFDTTLELLDEFGHSLAYNDDAPFDEEYTTDSALAVLLSPGRYQVVVGAFFSDDVGDGSFELELVRLVPER